MIVKQAREIGKSSGRVPPGEHQYAIAGAFQIDAVTQFLYTRQVLITLVIKVALKGQRERRCADDGGTGPSDTDDSHAVIDWLLTRSSSRGVFMTQSQFGAHCPPGCTASCTGQSRTSEQGNLKPYGPGGAL